MELDTQHPLLSRPVAIIFYGLHRLGDSSCLSEERVGRAGLCFLDVRVFLCVAENPPHSFRPRGAVPGSEGKQEREYFLDTGARFLSISASAAFCEIGEALE